MYEIIPEKTTRKLLNISQPAFTRSEVIEGEYKITSRTISPSRTSVETFIHEPFPMLTKLMEATSGLNVKPPTSSEASIVASYAFGGHFDCHVDAVRFIIAYAY